MNIRMNAVHIFLLFILVRLGECYNILVIFGHPGKSHYDVFKPLFQELGERGHNITILSHVKTDGDIKNGRDVLLSDTAITNFIDLSWFPGGRIQYYAEANLIAYFADLTCKSGLESETFQNFLKEDNHYDVILAEFFNSNCYYGLINKYKAPFIGLSSCPLMAWQAQWFGIPDNPSYLSTIFLGYATPMRFLERVENTVIHYAHQLVYKLFMDRPGTELSKKYIGHEPADPYNASLFLVNIHHSLHGARPLTPSMVEVGGIHVTNRKPKKLPQDIEKWTNGSISGLIYFSFGSLIKGHTFPEKQRDTFVKVFSKLPQRVLWKWENETMKDQPKNLMLTEWAPQFDILCHPNTKLFISHGGLLGTTEAIHCGVPILVMPQFADQLLNAQAVKNNEAGVILSLKDVTEESLGQALKQALSPETRQKAKELSQRFRDRIVSPIDTSLYWVEHVARYKGGQHMRSPAIDMPFYQYLLLDVVAFLAVVILALGFIIYKSLQSMLRSCLGSKQKIKTS